MIWAFVDYENVGSLESLDLEQYQRLIIFCGPRHQKLNLGEIPTSSFCHLELIRMASTGNNNLDFHLVFYLGVHHLKAGKNVAFHVISNDKGFDGVVAHLSEMGRTCIRVNSGKEKTAKKVAAKKTGAKKVVAQKVAAKKAAKVAAKKAVKKAVKKVAQKAAKKAVKKVVKKAAKKAAVSQRKHSAFSISECLKKCPNRSRPTRQDKLVNWISNRIGDEKMFTLDIYEDLIEAGTVIESAGVITYSSKIAAENKGGDTPKGHPYSSDDVKKLIAALELTDRPRNVADLEGWIREELNVPQGVAFGISKKLIREGCVQPSDDWIDYDFGEDY